MEFIPLTWVYNYKYILIGEFKLLFSLYIFKYLIVNFKFLAYKTVVGTLDFFQFCSYYNKKKKKKRDKHYSLSLVRTGF